MARAKGRPTPPNTKLQTTPAGAEQTPVTQTSAITAGCPWSPPLHAMARCGTHARDDENVAAPGETDGQPITPPGPTLPPRHRLNETRLYNNPGHDPEAGT